MILLDAGSVRVRGPGAYPGGSQTPASMPHGRAAGAVPGERVGVSARTTDVDGAGRLCATWGGVPPPASLRGVAYRRGRARYSSSTPGR
ncbi:hypothetical protein UG55_1001116 [Frankia sp. EI5c]|nr:hypothetical protein UG55_1001116 [Frankia sp. EI5c]